MGKGRSGSVTNRWAPILPSPLITTKVNVRRGGRGPFRGGFPAIVPPTSVTLVGMADVTRLLDEAAAGDRRAAADLLPLVYDEMRRLAAARMAGEPPDHTLQPTVPGSCGLRRAVVRRFRRYRPAKPSELRGSLGLMASAWSPVTKS